MKTLLISTLALAFLIHETQAQDLHHLSFTVEKATDWNSLFTREEGWFGGDGIYSIPLNGIEHKPSKTKTLFIFSDSMIGQVQNNKLKEGSKMVNNTVAILNNGKPIDSNLKFFWLDNKDRSPATIFKPNTAQTGPKDYYWLGDGFVNQELGNSLYIFGYRITQVASGTFGFKEVGNTIIKINSNSKPPYTDYTQKDTPFYLSEENGEMGSFGAGVYVNTKKSGAKNPDEYIYIYGVKGITKKLLVARVKPTYFEDFDKWLFWNGANWQSDIHQSATVTNEVSNELSVTQLPDGRYALIFQKNGISSTVGLRLGKTPYGPFGPIIKIWDSSEDTKEKGYFTYNAKAHPSLSKKGELLISYNINSFNFFDDLTKDPNLYRPRFIRLQLK